MALRRKRQQGPVQCKNCADPSAQIKIGTLFHQCANKLIER